MAKENPLLKKIVSFSINEVYARKLRILADEKNISVSKYVENLLVSHLEETNDKLIMSALVTLHERTKNISSELTMLNFIFEQYVHLFFKSHVDTSQFENEDTKDAIEKRVDLFFEEVSKNIKNYNPKLRYQLLMQTEVKE